MANMIMISGEYELVQSLSLASGQTPKPGQLLQKDSSGNLTANASATLRRVPYLALEDSLQGGLNSTAYTASTVARCAIPQRGVVSYVLLVAGQNVAIGDKLVSNAGGKFKKDTGTDLVLAEAEEALDLSASGAVDTLVKARWA